MSRGIGIRPAWPAVWIMLLGSMARADSPSAGPAVGAWELPRGGGLQASDLALRQGWRPLPPGAAKGPLAGGLALENQALVVLLPAGGTQIVLLAKGAGKAAGVRQALTLLGRRDEPAGGLHDIQVVDYDEGEAVVGFAAGEVQARLKLGLGKCFVELLPGKGAAAVQLRGRTRFAFIPDFFGNDVLFDAQETAAAKVFAPAENFIVSLVEGHAALSMLTWPKDGGEEVLLLCEGAGADRRFAATQVSFNGKSVFAAVVAREETWFEKDLRTARKDATLVVEGWQPPFPAKWMTLLVKRPAVGAASGIASETLPVPLLPREGDTPYSDVYVHPHVPSWFSGGQWRLHLESSLTHMMTHKKVVLPEFLLAINYPRDRLKQTPLDALTLVDVMRDTLGTGPCEYILDLEGLNKTRSTGAAGTGKPTASATCSERGGLVFYYLGERSESPRRDDPLMLTDEALTSIEKIKDFLDAAYARIQEYLSWSDEIVRVAEQSGARNPQARDLAGRIIPIARQMRELWQTMVEHDKPCVHPQEWRMALDQCKDLVRQGAPDLGNRIREFDPQMRGAGEEVDGGMQACRLIVKRIRQEAAVVGSDDPAALKLAADIRRRCRDILRNKHYKEGDSVRLGE
ncbi:MAG: hypothetical protein ABSF26_01220 [Thermoguttaceae bacterium]